MLMDDMPFEELSPEISALIDRAYDRILEEFAKIEVCPVCHSKLLQGMTHIDAAGHLYITIYCQECKRVIRRWRFL